MMTLKQFIEEKGEEYCANLFGRKVRTIQSWRRNEGAPTRKKALEIIAKTNGALNLQGIYINH